MRFHISLTVESKLSVLLVSRCNLWGCTVVANRNSSSDCDGDRSGVGNIEGGAGQHSAGRLDHATWFGPRYPDGEASSLHKYKGDRELS